MIINNRKISCLSKQLLADKIKVSDKDVKVNSKKHLTF